MLKTIDNLRRGRVLELVLDFNKDGNRRVLPAEMEWCEKWVISEIINATTIIVRSAITHVDIKLYYSDSRHLYTQLDGSYMFIPTLKLMPLPNPKRATLKRSVSSFDSIGQVQFIKRHYAKSMTALVSKLLRGETIKIISKMVRYEVREFENQERDFPTYLITQDSVISNNYAFLKALKLRNGGKLYLEEMCWRAFEY